MKNLQLLNNRIKSNLHISDELLYAAEKELQQQLDLIKQIKAKKENQPNKNQLSLLI